jgi:hypothetical protein
MLASRTGQIAPKPITASDIALESPRNRMATGMTAEAGNGRRNSSVGSNRSRASRDDAIAAPSPMPARQASIQPKTMRRTVAASGTQIDPSAMRATSTLKARDGAGKNIGEIRRASASTCHMRTRPRAKDKAPIVVAAGRWIMPPSRLEPHRRRARARQR